MCIRDRKKAAENGTVQITAAGDLCLEEDGYVLDYYDTVSYTHLDVYKRQQILFPS